MRQSATDRDDRSNHCCDIAIFSFFDFLQNGGHPPSWICCLSVWTTHKEYLVAFYHCAKFGWNLQ